MKQLNAHPVMPIIIEQYQDQNVLVILDTSPTQHIHNHGLELQKIIRLLYIVLALMLLTCGQMDKLQIVLADYLLEVTV